jgi:hypothetical protein
MMHAGPDQEDTMRIPIICLCGLLIAAGAASAAEAMPAAAGYQGIWFELGQKSQYGDKYSGGLGTYTTSHVPIAIHAPRANKTFFTYGGTIPGKKHLLIMASFYDHATGMVPRPTIVHDKQGVDDPHDDASLCIDPEGFVWVFISGRGNSRPGFIYRSVRPYAVDAFELIHTRQRMAYPQPWYIDGEGFLFLFTMYTRGREAYWMTSADGRDWSGPVGKLAGFGGHYQTSAQRGREIITAFNYHPGGNVDRRTNLYLLRTVDMGRTWTSAAGEPVPMPLENKANPALVRNYEAEGRMVYIQEVTFDEKGQPVVLYVESGDHRPGPQDPPRAWIIAHWKNAERAWTFNRVTTSTHNYDVGALYVEPDGTWRIIGPSEPGPQHWGTGGEMAMWTSADQGRTWTRVRQLTASSPRNHSYARRPVDAHEGFYALWADGDADRFSESHLYFATRRGDVYRLPPVMEQQVQRPEPIVPGR